MFQAKYIKNILEGIEPPGSPPSEHPWSELSSALTAVPLENRYEVLAEWAQNNNCADEIISDLIELKFTDTNIEKEPGVIWQLSRLTKKKLGNIPVLVGEQNNAKIVRGEGHLIFGPPGIGKTSFMLDSTLRMACGLNFLGFKTIKRLKILILQAELPIKFVQYRFNRMIQGYKRKGISGMEEALERIYVYELNQTMNLNNSNDIEIMSNMAEETEADIIVIDPFLPFFSGEENSNSEVRKALDQLKYGVAEKNNCAILMTDHVTKNFNGNDSWARGAGAKVDWASLVINLSGGKYAGEQAGQDILVKLTKVRYGWASSEPITLRRDEKYLIHNQLDSNDKPQAPAIACIIKDEGGLVKSQNLLLKLIRDRLNIGGRKARQLLDTAVNERIISTEKGKNNSIHYSLTTQDENEDESDIESLL